MLNSPRSKQVLLYLPVVHLGYKNFIRRHRDASDVFVLGKSIYELWPKLRKDVRALDPLDAARLMRAIVGSLTRVRVIETRDLPDIVNAVELVLPDEEITRGLAEQYGLAARARVVFDDTFLCWDRANASAARLVRADAPAIAGDELTTRFYGTAAAAAGNSSDWWRQVGAVIARGDRPLITAYNRHLPTEYAPYINGDPRAAFSQGVRLDLFTSIHAEAAAIAGAARDGIALSGASIYITTFPCPNCAHLIAESGITTVYYGESYAVLDGEEVLRAAGVKMIPVISPA